jgi:integrase
MRRGEILGLKWDDINFNKMEFEIKRSAVHKKGVGTVTDKTKNEKSMRKLALPYSNSRKEWE